MIRLKKIEIHVNEDFANEQELNDFKSGVAADVANRMKNKQTIYNTFETHENKLITNK